MLVATQHNARLHFAATLAVVALGAFCGLTRLEWAAVVLATGLVWVAETTNTAIERLGDAVTTERLPELRDAKDLAAGAVLVASATAAAVGLLVFLPHLFSLSLRLSR